MNYKVGLSFILSLLFLSTSSLIYGQGSITVNKPGYEGDSDKFAIMLSQPKHMETAIVTAEMLDIANRGYTFEVVMVGPLAKEMSENPDFKKYIDMSEKLGIKLSVCGIALERQGVDESKVDERIHITANAWLRIYELQDKGYNVITN